MYFIFSSYSLAWGPELYFYIPKWKELFSIVLFLVFQIIQLFKNLIKALDPWKSTQYVCYTNLHAFLGDS